MKMATALVVPPSRCKEVDRGWGISTLKRDNTMPDKIDTINGFLGSLETTIFKLVHMVDLSSLYSSKTVMEMVTLKIEVNAADKVARCFP